MNEKKEVITQRSTVIKWYRIKEYISRVLKIDELFDLGHTGRGFTDFKEIKVDAKVEEIGDIQYISFDNIVLIDGLIAVLKTLPEISEDRSDWNKTSRKLTIVKLVSLLENRKYFLNEHPFKNSLIVIETDPGHFDYRVSLSNINEA